MADVSVTSIRKINLNDYSASLSYLNLYHSLRIRMICLYFGELLGTVKSHAANPNFVCVFDIRGGFACVRIYDAIWTAEFAFHDLKFIVRHCFIVLYILQKYRIQLQFASTIKSSTKLSKCPQQHWVIVAFHCVKWLKWTVLFSVKVFLILPSLVACLLSIPRIVQRLCPNS